MQKLVFYQFQFKFYPKSTTLLTHTEDVFVNKIEIELFFMLYFGPLIIFLVLHFILSFYLLHCTIKTIQRVFTISQAISMKKSDLNETTIVLNYHDCRFLKKHFLLKEEFEGNSIDVFETLKFFKMNIYLSILFYLMSCVLLLIFFFNVSKLNYISNTIELLISLSAFLSCADIDTCVRSVRQYTIFSDLFKKYAKAIIYFSLGFFIIVLMASLIYFS